MKIIKAIVCALVISLAFANIAEAKGRNGGSVYRGGFSSQRQNTPKPAPSYQAPANKTSSGGFGFFGKPKTNTQQANTNSQQSQMGQDLSKTAAQNNAMKTWDARNNRATNDNRNNYEKKTGNSNSYNTTYNTRNNGWPGANQHSPVIHQTVVHQNSGGFMHGVMWFMLGHAWAQHNNTVYVPVNNQPNVPPASDGSTATQWDTQPQDSQSANGIATQVQEAPAPETESFFTKALRWLLWGGFIYSVVWVVRTILRIRKQMMKVNYSLGN